MTTTIEALAPQMFAWKKPNGSTGELRPHAVNLALWQDKGQSSVELRPCTDSNWKEASENDVVALIHGVPDHSVQIEYWQRNAGGQGSTLTKITFQATMGAIAIRKFYFLEGDKSITVTELSRKEDFKTEPA